MGYFILKGLVGVTMALVLTVVSGSFAMGGGCPENAAAIQGYSDCGPCKIDLNGDGNVTVTDVILVKKCIQAGCEDRANDVNGDGKVSEDDADILLKCLKMSVKH